MILDDFKLAALSKSEGFGDKYNVVISTDEGDGVAYHVISVEHKEVPIYFDFETDEEDGFDFDYILELAKEEIYDFDCVLLDPTLSDQKSYLMSNIETIFAYQCENYGLRFNRDIKAQVKEYISDLVVKNNEDFIKTYKELVEFIYQDSVCFESTI